ncbi:hypothetical protein UFOVP860_95 [uncultured Caudovirales phage]|uniref:Uncharacterized protein n=1 Tax=uncultured Caudovirales phage TaxID=2100421 RepID=A0A6J5T3T3_9CAUD|nr:hypothetical protein UFOVP860_95 [uncultured Caudovirales phage]CAB4195217.1 hypothetical protein UFOVP1293_16 [uncultured Caudovirales phage]CAB4222435.1 hypothetical protein UFOVP1644_34 [uncultured Caudovirales phage]
MFAEKIGESCSTTGTGTFSLGGAYGAFRTWGTGFSNSDLAWYYATNDTGSIWELGYGTFATGSPNTLTRTLVASSTGSLINWVTTPYRIYSVPSATILKHMLAPFINGVGNVPGWFIRGVAWLDYALGITTAWVKKRYVSGTVTSAASHAEEGRYFIGLDSGVTHIFAASQRMVFVDKGAASYTFTADDIGKCLCFDTTAAVRVLTMLANNATGMGHGAYVFVKPYGSSSNGVTFTPGGSDTTDLATAPAGRVTKFQWDGAKSKWVADYFAPAAVSTPGFGAVRQTVAAGPVDTAGLPTFLPSTSGSLSVTSQNVTSSAPLVAASASNWSATTGQSVDRVGYSSSNLTWSGLTASRAAATPNYLYVLVNADGTLTTGSTLLAPVYQRGGAPATTNGQFTFNYGEMKGYMGNGSTAPQAYIVFVGEAATDGSGVISTVAYAYNGQYENAFTATLPGVGVTVSANHNIGVKPQIATFLIECTTIDAGYAVGEQMVNPGSDNAGFVQGNPPHCTGKAIARTSGSGSTGTSIPSASTGAPTPVTAASWKYKFIAQRGW